MMTLQVVSPFDQSLIKEIPMQGAEHVEQALAKAHAKFQNIDQWLASHKRIKVLENTVEIMKIRKNELIVHHQLQPEDYIYLKLIINFILNRIF